MNWKFVCALCRFGLINELPLKLEMQEINIQKMKVCMTSHVLWMGSRMILGDFSSFFPKLY